jgi:uncharacterized damage-inducible protein DinB
MRLNELLLEAMNREVERSRRALQPVPEGKFDWKPHDRSMIFGYLAHLVAVIPSWVTAIVAKDELDVAPTDGSSMPPPKPAAGAALVIALGESAQSARDALTKTTDEHLQKPWQLKAAGQVVQQAPRYEMILDTLTHWAHHRGQLTVYLRLLEIKVPSIYGPSADDKAFR